MDAADQRLGPLLAGFTAERTNLLPALHAAHNAFGYLPEWAIERVGLHLHVPASEVYGVASGYPEFRFQPPAPNTVQICTGLSCRLAGADALLAALQSHAPASVESSPCLFLCALAPVAGRAGRIAGHVDVARLEALLHAGVDEVESLA